ncbi:ATP-binding protein [Patescibacteria group bacterium]|nr:ATP-binding protein [Patescibacteria group bacterium]MBU4000348.1 ATP-binding protein [Patescibacteria group bacterium]MBU4057122.1 ATP-binding protein [Patescibacteria group bacterium]MBU4368162.1 ATP-binding protein [Patescibacteria group bacterium]
MIFPRKIDKELKKQLNSKEIIILTGMRRTGKTITMNSLFDAVPGKNKIFLDLENPLNRKIFEETNYDNIWKNLANFGISNKEKSYIFLDEIQRARQIPSAVKYLHDHFDVKFFLTGSSSYYLKNLFSESLAGRKIIFELFPLDFEEYLIFQEKPKRFFADFREKEKQKNEVAFNIYEKYYDDYLEYGGFPKVVLEKNINQKKKLLNDVFASYFEQDVKTLADFKNIDKLRDLIILLSARAGSKIEITKLSAELGVSRETIYNYLSFLENTYFIFLVKPFSRNTDREISGARKVYFCDTGILNIMEKISSGAIFENAVFKSLKNYGKINYYQRRSGVEIDFILNKKIGFEAKNQGGSFDFKKLDKLSKSIVLEEDYVISKKYSKDRGVILAMDI